MKNIHLSFTYTSKRLVGKNKLGGGGFEGLYGFPASITHMEWIYLNGMVIQTWSSDLQWNDVYGVFLSGNNNWKLYNQINMEDIFSHYDESFVLCGFSLYNVSPYIISSKAGVGQAKHRGRFQEKKKNGCTSSRFWTLFSWIEVHDSSIE